MSILGPTRTVVVEVTGADRLTYLEAVTTQHLTDLAVGEVRGAMYLDAHGSPQAVFDVVGREDRLLLLVPDDALADEVVKVLGGRTFLSDATFARTDDTVVAVRGGTSDGAAALLGEVSLGHARDVDGVVVVGRRDGADLVGPTPEVGALAAHLTAAGVEEVSATAIAERQVVAGEPAWGREITPPHLPEELGLLPTHVHLAKGCYPGQEAVARMWMLGRPRRRLARVEVDAGLDAGAQVGTGKSGALVTAVVDADGTRRGLAFVPGTAEPGDRVEADGTGVTVVDLVGDDLPVVGHDPAMTRRRDKR